jgi:hypothetical protein
VEHYDYHPYKDNRAGLFRGSVKQDILEPVPFVLEKGYCQVNCKCLGLLWSNWSEYKQVRNRPQSMRQYLPQDHKLDDMLNLCKNSNSGLTGFVLGYGVQGCGEIQ